MPFCKSCAVTGVKAMKDNMVASANVILGMVRVAEFSVVDQLSQGSIMGGQNLANFP